jgi:hypothetical protein
MERQVTRENKRQGTNWPADRSQCVGTVSDRPDTDWHGTGGHRAWHCFEGGTFYPVGVQNNWNRTVKQLRWQYTIMA